MAKRNISYIKPEEPAFLKRLKEQAGYKESYNIDTKREKLPENSDDDDDFIDEEQPTVVVLKSGDLTAEEAEKIKQQIELENSKKPADLSQKVVFSKPKSKKDNATEKSNNKDDTKKQSKTKKSSKPILSFDDEDEET